MRSFISRIFQIFCHPWMGETEGRNNLVEGLFTNIFLLVSWVRVSTGTIVLQQVWKQYTGRIYFLALAKENYWRASFNRKEKWIDKTIAFFISEGCCFDRHFQLIDVNICWSSGFLHFGILSRAEWRYWRGNESLAVLLNLYFTFLP